MLIADRMAIPWRLSPDIGAESHAQRGRNKQDGQHLQEVGERRRVFQRMRRIDIEEATAIGTQLLDGHLRGHRADGNALLVAGDFFGQRLIFVVKQRLTVGAELRLLELDRFERRRRVMCGESLHHTLAAQRNGQADRQRQQDVERRAHHIYPEIAERIGFPLHEAARQGDQDCHTGGGREEVLDRQTEHLGQVAQRRFAAVALPVGIGDKADGGVEGQIGRRAGHPVGIERQITLQALQGKDNEETQQVEDQQGHGVTRPVHPVFMTDPGQPVKAALDRAQPADKVWNISLVDAGHVNTQRPGEQQQDGEINADLQITIAGHEKFSGKKRTATR
jgi:hypothetical protein